MGDMADWVNDDSPHDGSPERSDECKHEKMTLDEVGQLTCNCCGYTKSAYSQEGIQIMDAMQEATISSLKMATEVIARLTAENERLRGILEKLHKKVDNLTFDANLCVGLCAEALHGGVRAALKRGGE